MLKKYLALALVLALLLCSCAAAPQAQEEDLIAATTYPVWQFTSAVIEGSGLRVERVITEPVSCVHDYALSVDQMKILARSRAVVISGLGLEDFMEDVLPAGDACIDASTGIQTLCAEEHDHDHDAHSHAGHDHGEEEPHIWLDPDRAAQMVGSIVRGLSALYPEHAERFAENAAAYCAQLEALKQEGIAELSQLSCRELVTFHDGFAYFADAFGLEIAAAMEVEAGSEPPARELEEIVLLLRERGIPAVFSEASGSADTAELVAAEDGAGVYTLDMGFGTRDYLTAMRYNLETVKEALQ